MQQPHPMSPAHPMGWWKLPSTTASSSPRAVRVPCARGDRAERAAATVRTRCQRVCEARGARGRVVTTGDDGFKPEGDKREDDEPHEECEHRALAVLLGFMRFLQDVFDAANVSSPATKTSAAIWNHSGAPRKPKYASMAPAVQNVRNEADNQRRLLRGTSFDRNVATEA